MLEGATARVDRCHGGAEQAHAVDVEPLASHVLGAHVDHTLEPQQRCRGRRRHAVLAGAGFGDDAALAHLLREQTLAEGVVDLVSTRVEQIFPLEEDPRPAELLAQSSGKGQGGWTADEIGEQLAQTAAEAAAGGDTVVGLGELLHRRHQRFGNVAAPVGAEVPAGVRLARRSKHLVPPQSNVPSRDDP
jgi:hypothetical protein